MHSRLISLISIKSILFHLLCKLYHTQIYDYIFKLNLGVKLECTSENKITLLHKIR